MKAESYKIIGLLCALIALPCQATVLVQGNATPSSFPPFSAGTTFNQQVLSEVFDRATGTFYVGLAAGAGSYAVSSIGRQPLVTIPPKFTPLANGTSFISNQNISFLALATSTGNTLASIVGNTGNGFVFAIPNPGLTAQSAAIPPIQNSPALRDASGALGSNGQTVSSIAALAANQNFIFAAVPPASGTFGQANSGIAVVRIVNSTTCPPVPISLNQTAAVAGDAGIKAQKVDPTVAVVKTAASPSNPVISPTPVLYWDDPLQVLYIGLQIATGGAAGDGAKSVVVGQVVNGVLNLTPIMPDAPLVAGDATRIVGAVQAATTLNLAVGLLSVMHTSTGPSYLIVNGGNGTELCNGASTDVSNMIFALPLVDNAAVPSINGTLADKNSALSTKDANLGTVKFTIPATTTAGLPSNTDVPVVVGGGPFPLQPGQCIQHMVVVGDTVFASANQPQSATNDSGIFYSQAEFDNTGKIVRWTPWSKRGFPFNGFPGAMNASGVTFFEVDAVTGNLWAVGGDTGQTVTLTQWDIGTSPTSLVAEVRSTLSDGCFSVLDLDQSTRALGANAPGRYALFGGAAKIVFTQTSTSVNATAPFNVVANNVPAPQLVTQDFSLPQNFFLTYLPGNAGPVTSLEFSRCSNAQQTYFYAGNNQGLYVFTDPNGNGFTLSNTFGPLNAPPFTTGIWQKISAIPGAVIDIKSAGQNLYVLTAQSSAQQPFNTTLYRIPFTTNIATMFTPTNMVVIAKSLTNPIFGSTQEFTGIQIIKTGAVSTAIPPVTEDSKEQLVMGTNTGLYISNADQVAGSGIISATNQTTANWFNFNPNNTSLYSAVAGMDAPLPATVWPLNVADLLGYNTFERSVVSQLSGVGNTAGTAALFNTQFIPLQFDGSSTTQPFQTLLPIHYFFSDGARRIFIINRKQDKATVTRLMISPWDVQSWNVTDPSNDILFTPALTIDQRFFWVRQIGATGILMAGTNHGVMGLE